MSSISGTVASVSAETSTPLRMLQEGKHQSIIVDPTKLLPRIMDALGSAPPILSEINCGAHGIKVSIKVEFNLDGRSSIVVFDGGPSNSNVDAEKEAIIKSLRHVHQVCQINIVDYASRVVSTFGSYKTSGLLKEVIASVEQILASFEKVLLKSKELAAVFETNEVKLIISGEISNNYSLNRDTSRFLEAVVRRSSIVAEEARTKFSSIKSQSDHHQTRVAKRSRQISMNGPSKRLVLSAKYLLNYVLSYFGFPNATYSNSPGDVMEGTAMFTLPYIKGVEFGGNMNLKGTGHNSITAEDDAAFQSLLMIEQNYNVQIVDLRHSHRLNAEKVIKDKVVMIGHMLLVGESVKNAWQNMIHELKEYREHLSYCRSSLVIEAIRQHEIPYFEECINSIGKLEQDSAKLGYEYCLEMFCVLDDISSKLNALKNKLGII